jgi:stage II sporulation protein D
MMPLLKTNERRGFGMVDPSRSNSFCVSAQGMPWQQLASADVELLTTTPERDRAVLPLVSRLLHESEESTGLVYRSMPRLKIYATVADFRNATAEPGWVAASTRGRTIQMQPVSVLRTAGTLDATLRHELMHMLIESYARPGTPLWFREGLVLYLGSSCDSKQGRGFGDVAALEKTLRTPGSEVQMRGAYTEACRRVAQLAAQHGKAALLDWIQNGVPAQMAASLPVQHAGKR